MSFVFYGCKDDKYMFLSHNNAIAHANSYLKPKKCKFSNVLIHLRNYFPCQMALHGHLEYIHSMKTLSSRPAQSIKTIPLLDPAP